MNLIESQTAVFTKEPCTSYEGGYWFFAGKQTLAWSDNHYGEWRAVDAFNESAVYGIDVGKQTPLTALEATTEAEKIAREHWENITGRKE